MTDTRILAIIPARGGSKRLPKKNILPFCGKPLIQWAIEEAQKVKEIDNLFVTTDCSEIADVAKQCGAWVPELRPKHLANDTSSTADVIDYVIKYCESVGKKFDYFILLQPTSPLRNSHHIVEAIDLAKERRVSSVISVNRMAHPVEWIAGLNENNTMEEFTEQLIASSRRSQDCKESFILNGAIYIVDVEVFKEEKDLFYGKNSVAYIMDESDSVDIDTKQDFAVAECLLKYKMSAKTPV